MTTHVRRTDWLICAVALILVAPAASSLEYEAGQVVVSLQPGHTIEEVNAVWGTSTLDAYPEGNLYLLDATDLGDVEELAAQMAGDPAVLEAEANYEQETPESIRQMVIVIVGGGYADYEDQTIGLRIGLDEAHQFSRGAGVTLAVLDTGIDPDHEAFAGRISPLGYDFVSNDADPREEANGLDDDLDQLIDEGFGHGTMVAGIATLVAPEATLLPVRVLSDEGNGDAYVIAKGIHYAVSHGARVLNLSFGVPTGISIIGHQIASARDQGAVIIAGAGNENLEQAYFPAAEDEAEMVTAVDSLDIKAAFADWHSKVLVSAPGTGVRSAFPGGGWALGEGCSFATPFVAGHAVLIRSLVPLESPDAIRERIRASVIPIDDRPENAPYQEKLGSGRIFLPFALYEVGSVSEPGQGTSAVFVGPNPANGFVRLAAPFPLRDFEVRVFDGSGRLVRVLDRSDSPRWDGRTADRRPAASGPYFIRLSGRDREFTARVTVIR